MVELILGFGTTFGATGFLVGAAIGLTAHRVGGRQFTLRAVQRAWTGLICVLALAGTASILLARGDALTVLAVGIVVWLATINLIADRLGISLGW